MLLQHHRLKLLYRCAKQIGRVKEEPSALQSGHTLRKILSDFLAGYAPSNGRGSPAANCKCFMSLSLEGQRCRQCLRGLSLPAELKEIRNPKRTRCETCSSFSLKEQARLSGLGANANPEDYLRRCWMWQNSTTSPSKCLSGTEAAK